MTTNLSAPICIENDASTTTLAIHLYDVNCLERLVEKIKPLLTIADQIWLSSTSTALLEKAESLVSYQRKTVRTFVVDNLWHDWSGYIAFLEASKCADRLIICNDSIVKRRIISGKTMNRFISALQVKQPFIIGELDTANCSVDLDGWASASWISTYLFSIQGISIDTKLISLLVKQCVHKIKTNNDHFFNQYLLQRRPGMAINTKNNMPKLSAMFFERWLLRIAIESGTPIIDYCAGSRLRKLERLLERLRDK